MQHALTIYFILYYTIYTHTRARLTVIFPGEPGLASSPLTLPLHTSSLTPPHHVLLRQEKERQ